MLEADADVHDTCLEVAEVSGNGKLEKALQRAREKHGPSRLSLERRSLFVNNYPREGSDTDSATYHSLLHKSVV